ncbi:MAG: hypothetical protein ACYC3Q_02840 [Gemmatimonadaceae bacterium]
MISNNAIPAQGSIEEFREALLERLQTRPGAKRAAFRLDLRHRDFGAKGYVTLRQPDTLGWPERGRFTFDQEEAREWVSEHYAAWLWQERHGTASPAAVAGAARGTFGAAADAYLEALRMEKGEHHNTYRNRQTHVEVHLRPKLGDLGMVPEAFSKRAVRQFLEQVTVNPRKYGNPAPRPASPAQRSALRDTLSAIWRHHFDDEIAPPFTGLRLENGAEKRARIEAIKEGVVGVGKKVRAYTQEEIVRALVAAWWYDRTVLSALPNVACTTIPNSPAAVASLYANAMRIEEMNLWRHCHIFESEGAVWVPGTKTDAAPRFMPLQETLQPWIDWSRALVASRGLACEPEDFVVRATWTKRRDNKGKLKPSGRGTYGNRLALILTLAGLKVPGKRTHIFRGSHITQGKLRPDLIDGEKLQQYVGHANPHGEVTSLYVDERPPFIPPAHRTYIELPTPDEVERLAASFRPTLSVEAARAKLRESPIA